MWSQKRADCSPGRFRLQSVTSRTWKGMHPIVTLSQKVYQKGVTLSKKVMRAVEARLERHPALPKWDMLIHPALP